MTNARRTASGHAATQPTPPAISVPGPWSDVFHGQGRAALEQVLPGYIAPRRWFGSKARAIQAVQLLEAIALADAGYLALLYVSYAAAASGEPETYVLPLAFATGERAEQLRRQRPASVVANLHTSQGEGILYDAVWRHRFCHALLDVIGQGGRFEGTAGDIVASTTSAFARLRGVLLRDEILEPAVHGGEQSNTSIFYGDRLILKLFRRLESGVNPDLEIGAFLTEKTTFGNAPPVAGALEYRRQQTEVGEPVTLALLQAFVPNQGDAWRHTLEVLSVYLATALAQPAAAAPALPLPQQPLLDLAEAGIPEPVQALIGPYLDSARLLGRRTAELHLALASDSSDPAFAPEPFSLAYQQALQQSMCSLNGRVMHLLRDRLTSLPAAAQAAAQQVLAREAEIAGRFDSLLERQLSGLRTRIHGDYHLGQVLYTGQDFMIIDFEGEPARPLSERRQKRSALQDVAGMLRSFHYAAYAAYFTQAEQLAGQPEALARLEAPRRFWHRWVSLAFLQAYLQAAGDAAFLPHSREDLRLLLDAYLLEKAVYELGYELNNRPDWVRIPLQGILQTL